MSATGADRGLFGSDARTGWHRPTTTGRHFPAVDPKYADDTPECRVCGSGPAGCKEACG